MLYWKHVPYNSCASLIWVLYVISIFLDWRLRFEPTLWLKGWNLRVLQNETHMRASILNTDGHIGPSQKSWLGVDSRMVYLEHVVQSLSYTCFVGVLEFTPIHIPIEKMSILLTHLHGAWIQMLDGVIMHGRDLVQCKKTSPNLDMLVEIYGLQTRGYIYTWQHIS